MRTERESERMRRFLGENGNYSRRPFATYIPPRCCDFDTTTNSKIRTSSGHWRAPSVMQKRRREGNMQRWGSEWRHQWRGSKPSSKRGGSTATTTASATTIDARTRSRMKEIDKPAREKNNVSANRTGEQHDFFSLPLARSLARSLSSPLSFC